MNYTSFLNRRSSVIITIVSILLSGCTSKERVLSSLSKDDKHTKVYVGHFKSGKPYTVKNNTYVPMKNVHEFAQNGMASWYGRKDHGKTTANGDKFNIKLLTAAHKSLPLPSMVEVENLENSKKLVLMVNDRGPFVKDRIIDVSEKAAEILGFKNKGVAKVRIKFLKTETAELLDKLNLEPKHGYVAKSYMKDRKCSVNCHIKLVNLKKGLISEREAIN